MNLIRKLGWNLSHGEFESLTMIIEKVMDGNFPRFDLDTKTEVILCKQMEKWGNGNFGNLDPLIT